MKIAVVDTETTGETAADRVIEIAIITADGKSVSEWSSFVRPDPPAANRAQFVNHITPSMLGEAPTFVDIAEEICARLDGRTVVAHNVDFDRRMILGEFKRAQLEPPEVVKWRCTLAAARAQGQRSLSLQSCCARFGIAQTARHRALGDCQACFQLFRVVGAHPPMTHVHRIRRRIDPYAAHERPRRSRRR